VNTITVKGKYDLCEHCNKPRLDGELLHAVECWKIYSFDGRRHTYYWLTCDDCYETRQEWCEGVFPDNCENCGAAIEYSEHYLEKEFNQRGKLVQSDGLSLDETCRIVCKRCTPQKVL